MERASEQTKDDLKGQVVVITGASSGFGKGAALRFAELGSNLVLASRRLNLLEELAQMCQAQGVEAKAALCDVSNPEEVKNICDTAVSIFGKIDVWINNAGVGAVGSFTDVPIEEQKKTIETNLLGEIYGSYYALTQFKTQGHGTIINVASAFGRIPGPYYAAYVASKFGIVGLSASLRQELKEQNYSHIHVCTVLPMAMDTPFFEHAATHSGHEAVPVPPLDDANKVIEAFVDLAIHPKDEVAIGKGAGIFSLSHQLMPSLIEKMMAKNVHKTQQEAPLKEPDSGSVIKPLPGTDSVKGKYRAS